MEFLMDMVNGVWRMLGDWPTGTIIGVIVIACVLVVAGLILWGVCRAVDSWFLPRKRDMGTVVGKTYTPEHTQLISVYNAATKTSIPQPVTIPDNWSVGVEVNGLRDSMSVKQAFYDRLSRGDSVMTEYVTGRFSGGLYLKSLEIV